MIPSTTTSPNALRIFRMAGEKLKIRQEEIKLKGHAIECRINAEDPQKNFMPCPGTVEDLHFPGGNGVRIESALYNGYVIPPYYDSMVAKVIVHGEDRMDAIRKMREIFSTFIADVMVLLYILLIKQFAAAITLDPKPLRHLGLFSLYWNITGFLKFQHLFPYFLSQLIYSFSK